MNKFEKNSLSEVEFSCENCKDVFTYGNRSCGCLSLECPAGCKENLLGIEALNTHINNKC